MNSRNPCIPRQAPSPGREGRPPPGSPHPRGKSRDYHAAAGCFLGHGLLPVLQFPRGVTPGCNSNAGRPGRPRRAAQRKRIGNIDLELFPGLQERADAARSQWRGNENLVHRRGASELPRLYSRSIRWPRYQRESSGPDIHDAGKAPIGLQVRAARSVVIDDGNAHHFSSPVHNGRQPLPARRRPAARFSPFGS